MYNLFASVRDVRTHSRRFSVPGSGFGAYFGRIDDQPSGCRILSPLKASSNIG